MYIYNVTINIEESVHGQWLAWMKDKHIPDMLATGKFLSAKLCRVLVEEEMGGITYAVQYSLTDKETLENYYQENAKKMREDGLKRFPDKFVAFRTELEVVSEQHSEIIPATEYLFTYGTLQDKIVQQELFSRILEGRKDNLPGHKVAEKRVGGLYPTIVYTGNSEDSVDGELFIISGSELRKADLYEGKAYKREKLSLDSGIKAWVYRSRISGVK